MYILKIHEQFSIRNEQLRKCIDILKNNDFFVSCIFGELFRIWGFSFNFLGFVFLKRGKEDKKCNINLLPIRYFFFFFFQHETSECKKDHYLIITQQFCLPCCILLNLQTLHSCIVRQQTTCYTDAIFPTLFLFIYLILIKQGERKDVVCAACYGEKPVFMC